jgi:hypothetical protein
MAPVVLLATWNTATSERVSKTASAIVASIAAGFIVLLPYLLINAGPNVLQGVSSLLRHDMLSADAANFWWVVTYVMRAIYAVGDMGMLCAWTMTMGIIGVSTIVRLSESRPFATAQVITAIASREEDVPDLSIARLRLIARLARARDRGARERTWRFRCSPWLPPSDRGCAPFTWPSARSSR